MKIRKTLLCAAMIGAAAPAAASDFYMSLGFGSFDVDTSVNQGRFLGDFTTGEVTGVSPPLTIPAGSPLGWTTYIDDDTSVSLAAGWQRGQLRYELEYLGLEADIATHTGVSAAGIDLGGIDAGVLLTGNVGDLGVTVAELVADGRGDIDSQTLFFNTYYDFRPGEAFTPYIGIGLGYTDTDINFAPSGVNVLNDGESYFTYQAIVGASYDLTETIELYGNYRYWPGDDVTGVSTLLNAELDVEVGGGALELGLRYHFD